MPIPETQLATWSHQGSIAQSRDTYKSLKAVLESREVPYSSKSYKVFLQGSYGNDTNIYSESDVDIVIRTKSCFQHDLSSLPTAQQEAFEDSHSDATYTHIEFKEDVLNVLSGKFDRDVTSGEKAIAIAASGNRRKSDVIAAIQFRRYHKFLSISDQSFDEGICFYTQAGTRIVNYPKQHSANLTIKHQGTSNRFKPMARILKNIRSRLVKEAMIEDGTAPSYYLEGLLYNVPNDHFSNRYVDSFANVVNWLLNTGRTELVCANEQYYLLRPDSPVTWREEQCEKFLTATVDLWNQW